MNINFKNWFLHLINTQFCFPINYKMSPLTTDHMTDHLVVVVLPHNPLHTAKKKKLRYSMKLENQSKFGEKSNRDPSYMLIPDQAKWSKVLQRSFFASDWKPGHRRSPLPHSHLSDRIHPYSLSSRNETSIAPSWQSNAKEKRSQAVFFCFCKLIKSKFISF